MDETVKCKMLTTFIENSRRIFRVGEIVEFSPKVAAALEQLGRVEIIDKINDEVEELPKPAKKEYKVMYDENGFEYDESINDVEVKKPKKELESTATVNMDLSGDIISTKSAKHFRGRPPKIK